ncbi:MAG: S8/S53 family peptidase [Granulosicoccus sp.]|nr:S8/S53 family peptidase [Granulosicoccus sp.]
MFHSSTGGRCGALAAALLAGSVLAEDPPIPEIQHSQAKAAPGLRVALVDSGVNYQLAEINSRLARQIDGSLLGYDFWDLDDRPFDVHPTSNGAIERHGTRTASVLLREAPGVELVPYRYPRPDMSRMTQLVSHAAENEVRIIGLPLGGNRREEWLEFEQAARAHADILFVASAGNNGRDIDRQPVYPASLDIPNMLVVTSADDFAEPAVGVNWGRVSVDYMVPAEALPVTDFNGRTVLASGSSYAVPRVVALAARLLQQDPALTVDELLGSIRSRFANGAAPRQLAMGYLYDPQQDPRQQIGVIDSANWASTWEHPELQATLPIDVLILDGRWSDAEVVRVLEQAQDILAFCGIRFTDVSLRRIRAPEYLRDLHTGSARTLMEAIRYSGPARRTTIVFARDTRMSTPFDAEAFGKANTRTRPWLTDTVWLTLALRDRGIALAHELFHVLSNSGTHSSRSGNLMLSRTTGNNRTLEAQQCDDALNNAIDSKLALQP